VTTQIHPENCRDSSTQVNGGPAPTLVSSNQFTEHSKLLPWLMLCALMSGFAVAASVSCIIVQGWLMHEYHVMSITVENNDALLLRYGIKQPGDMARGPNGNLDYQPAENK
jgi:hypothetical protein